MTPKLRDVNALRAVYEKVKNTQATREALDELKHDFVVSQFRSDATLSLYGDFPLPHPLLADIREQEQLVGYEPPPPLAMVENPGKTSVR